MRSPHEAAPLSDVCSLGVTWYEMLTGEILFPQMFVAGDIPDPCDSSKVNDLINRMVSYRPDDRPSLDEISPAIRGV